MKRNIALLLVLALLGGMIAACTAPAAEPSTQQPTEKPVEQVTEKPAEQPTEKPAEQPAQTPTEAPVDPDQAAADRVAALIDAIYVQQRTDTTDLDCAAAKAAWDALTDTQKALVQGEEADPDYFGRDTGDASKDDPRNRDEHGANELLVVSFGTSFNDSRAMDIGGIEAALEAEFPEWSVRRAFTAQIIINHVQARDGEFIDNMDQALDRAVMNGVKNLIVQPTHLMHGAEYDELVEAVTKYADKMNIVVAEPLLGQVGKDAAEVNTDKQTVAKAVVDAAVKAAGAESLEALEKDGTALVLMGHGTAHSAKVTYSQMQTQMKELGYKNVFIGTVEGEPEETACEAVIEAVSAAGYTKVILRPLMVVAGDHANNDMADPEDEESWLSQFKASEKFADIQCQIAGLGRIPEVQALYVEHTQAVIDEKGLKVEAAAAPAAALADGVYKATFKTDSSMFHVNEAHKGQGVLTVKDGQMTIHISLVSKNITNLFPGLKDDAQKEGAAILEPTTDTVKYDDGTTEEVYGFDVPVPALDEEFDLAILGKSGKWNDHKVVVTNPVPEA